MATLSLARDVTFPRDHVYDIVADVARYPDFLPGFQAVRVEGHRGHELIVRQSLGLKGLRQTFRTYATFDRPNWIRIRTTERPFRTLDQVWRFEEPKSHQTRVRLDVEYTFSDPLVKRFSERLFPFLMRQSMDAFIDRARRTDPRRAGHNR
ncbi:coenzyme Q-binding protein COQ10 [Rhodothalassium salexigens DSM 2132]|uniref:Coenzyme Q-binding protein COQ10 n=1 Tax=Rhodothalassium salexigens DSM 2132 TaxID=1188247 RepID=A0A4R2PGZ9_RHOSA|nr:type II toxin-antitoxin system RatA family toxin [Rhodothalassium salexigens]MBB4211798.1 coenzyme Q-binding protein COQ10 [Rhodothalassium salexigens DSM 2132]MBK1638133.1 hypothetical protein [Rhodothalassium salexigens DSM 2132]TCP33904.1 coenzyme Q-binding protein COQ10 [Rhodothalassium salexigens DSM 2132]